MPQIRDECKFESNSNLHTFSLIFTDNFPDIYNL